MRRITNIVVHHSVSGFSTTAVDIDRWHRAPPNNFACLGYHFVIEGDGKLGRGRELNRPGAHIKRQNKNTIGICVVGDNTQIKRKWRASQIETLVNLTDVLEVMFPGAVTLGHRDMPNTNTACPGLNIKELLK